FLTKEAGNEYNSAPLPIQIIIDSGHYLRADRLIIEGLEIRWDEIDPGEVYVSSSAYRFLKDKQFLFIDPPFDAKKPKAFYRLVQSGKSQKASSPLFLYQSALTLGDNLPCYYCGARGHMTGDCPSKAMEIDATHALKELGYLSTSQINKLFFNYLAGTNTTHETAEEIKHNRTGSNLLAYHGFYELKLIFQLRFFRAMWDSDDENWDSIKDRKTNRQRGGPIWLAQDCIRASNLARAEEFLNTSMEEHPEDYKVYCAMGFINVERNDYRKAEYYFSQPLDLGYAKAKPQKTLLLFLLSRLYYLNGDYTKAEKKIGDVLSLYPRCPDAIYQNIIFGFRVGRHTKALADLRRLIQEYREYYVNALIDPELAPFNNIIHSQLEILLDQARDQARQGLPKAGMELKKLKRMIGENEKEVVEVQSLSAKMDGLSESGSYSGYLDVIQYSNSIVSMCRRILDSRRRRIFEFLYDLNNRCKKNLALANDFPYRNLVNSVHRQLKLVQTEIDKIKGMIVSDTADVFKKAFNQAEALSTTINDICLELKTTFTGKQLRNHHGERRSQNIR
ncbi:MAG: hypothetical protein SVW57_14830, partial [Thermodesulfobacteriota bacterium]|nr:hypothetical protein [Thermodesulfobacteriota bacterium]